MGLDLYVCFNLLWAIGYVMANWFEIGRWPGKVSFPTMLFNSPISFTHLVELCYHEFSDISQDDQSGA